MFLSQEANKWTIQKNDGKEVTRIKRLARYPNETTAWTNTPVTQELYDVSI